MTQQQNTVDALLWLAEQALRAQDGEQSRALVITMANSVGAEIQNLRKRVEELQPKQKESLED